MVMESMIFMNLKPEARKLVLEICARALLRKAQKETRKEKTADKAAVGQ